ncbi:MAG: hypothetical protein ACTS4W_01360, partial [Candidatus Hodgkinia cicadicola]
RRSLCRTCVRAEGEVWMVTRSRTRVMDFRRAEVMKFNGWSVTKVLQPSHGQIDEPMDNLPSNKFLETRNSVANSLEIEEPLAWKRRLNRIMVKPLHWSGRLNVTCALRLH